MRHQEGKSGLQKKYIEEFVLGTSLFWLRSLLYCFLIFCCFLCFHSPLAIWRTCWITLWKYTIMRWLVFCVMIPSVNSQNYANLLQFNTSWWLSLGRWYYFTLCFSLSSSDYDLTVIKKSHTLNCYLILQKFLLKTKSYKFVFGNCGSSIYCQNNKFRKSYLLFVTSASFNK